MTSRSRLLAGLLLAATLAGCGGAAAQYYDTQDEWTRHEKSYEQLDSRAFIYATLKTEPFRRAYVAEYARLFALTPEQRALLLDAELAEHERSIVVIAAFYTPQVAWNDLHPSRGFWEVRLEGPEGRYVHPGSVNRLAKKDPAHQRMYPYLDPHYTLYELRFDRDAADGAAVAGPGDTLDLIIAGAPTRLRLSWKLP